MSNMPHNKNLDSDPMHNCSKCFINAQGCIGSIKTGGGGGEETEVCSMVVV